MKMLRILFASAFLFASVAVQAQDVVYKYRIYLKDKKESPYKLKKPLEFLSQKALDRRAKWNIKVDEYDLPVSPAYVRRLAENGNKVLCMSKWTNTVLVQNSDSSVLEALAALPFVTKVEKVYAAPLPKTLPYEPEKRRATLKDTAPTVDNYYGALPMRITQLNLAPLHTAGYRGKGMTVAVIDGGFYNAEITPLLQGTEILGTHNFVNPEQSVYEGHLHGMCVLSCMATNKPRRFVGTAPEAAYWLLVSEDGASETPAEEDYWAAAVEFADSVGTDVVNTSLGYNDFDDKSMNVKRCELDGRTRLNSRAASLAASRGLMLVMSAGNSGGSAWKNITPPADAHDVLTVGAVILEGVNANFSSLGNTADGRIKPDVMALGADTPVIAPEGYIVNLSGTSFSSPTMAGSVACLMQALPDKRPEQIIKLLQQSGTLAKTPDSVMGYGIPDLWYAYMKGKYGK